MAALYARERTGVAPRVDIGMLDTTTAHQPNQASNNITTGRAPQRLGNRHPTIAPYETFRTSDGEIVIAVGNDGIWQRFCPAIGRPELAADPRFRTNRDRLANYAELRVVLEAALSTRTRADWTARFHEASVPCGAVRDVAEVLADPHLHAREMIGTLDHPTVGPTRVMGTPIKLSGTPGTLRTPPPTLGQHTAEVLEELGYDRESIARLKAAGAI
jgi:crotonobetainyl-CoA:carnitine CoA-transferase CaiB-like acyl-CoA transferase